MTDHRLHSVSWPGLSLHLRGQAEGARRDEEITNHRITKTYNIVPLASSGTEMQTVSLLYAGTFESFDGAAMFHWMIHSPRCGPFL